MVGLRKEAWRELSKRVGVLSCGIMLNHTGSPCLHDNFGFNFQAENWNKSNFQLSILQSQADGFIQIGTIITLWWLCTILELGSVCFSSLCWISKRMNIRLSHCKWVRKKRPDPSILFQLCHNMLVWIVSKMGLVAPDQTSGWQRKEIRGNYIKEKWQNHFLIKRNPIPDVFKHMHYVKSLPVYLAIVKAKEHPQLEGFVLQL